MDNIEIERKFLVKKLPDNLESYPKKEILQGYLNTSPAIRVRSENEEYFLTYKGSGFIKHSEYNLPLDRENFNRGSFQFLDEMIISASAAYSSLGSYIF